jgi:hypothetical protein
LSFIAGKTHKLFKLNPSLSNPILKNIKSPLFIKMFIFLKSEIPKISGTTNSKPSIKILQPSLNELLTPMTAKNINASSKFTIQ